MRKKFDFLCSRSGRCVEKRFSCEFFSFTAGCNFHRNQRYIRFFLSSQNTYPHFVLIVASSQPKIGHIWQFGNSGHNCSWSFCPLAVVVPPVLGQVLHCASNIFWTTLNNFDKIILYFIMRIYLFSARSISCFTCRQYEGLLLSHQVRLFMMNKNAKKYFWVKLYSYFKCLL